MRKWLIGLVVLALLAGGVAGGYFWYRHENGVERAVHARLEERHINVDWVSCTEDHTVRTGASTLTYYRCDPHGDADSIVCTPFVGGRIATEVEVRDIRLEDAFCEGQA